MDDSNYQIMLKRTTQVVAAFVAKNQLHPDELPRLIMNVYRALLAESSPAPEPEIIKTPAVSVRRSITAGYLICLEDGLKYKSLKRHLRTAHGMTPEDYIKKWNLAKDYPIVAPSYTAVRSALAKSIGLGKRVVTPKPSKLNSPRGKRDRASV